MQASNNNVAAQPEGSIPLIDFTTSITLGTLC